jgi:alpha-N-arabinofuranosidase
MLSFDEWNVWYRTRRNRDDRTVPGWPVAPPILEEVYTMADALAFGGACISLLNHADRVRCACLAQLVNVIAPIMTEDGGPAWRQTIFYPFAQMSHFGRGHVLRATIDSPTYDANYFDPRGAQDLWFPVTAPYLKLAAVEDTSEGITLFALNRHLTEEMPLTVALTGFPGKAIRAARTLHHPDLNAANTRDAPDTVRPAPLTAATISGDTMRATLPPASWNVIRLG